MTSLPDRTLDALRHAVGDRHVLVGEVAAGSAIDWTGRFRGTTPAVVRPGTTDEVAAVLRICDGSGVAVVPQGGNTGLVGGSVPLHHEVVLSLTRLRSLGPVDRLARQVTVGAGVTLASLDRHVAGDGLRYGVDFGSRDSATVGGTIATNAGGIHVLRFGMTRAQVAGVEAVLADGRIIRHLGGLAKDNTGYDLSGLLCGSEGTLAVVTAARLRLHPRPRHTVTAAAVVHDLASAVDLAARLRDRVPALEAVEAVPADLAAFVASVSGATLPTALGGGASPGAVLLVVEAADAVDPTAELAGVLDGDGSVAAVAVAGDPARRSALWRVREEATPAINTLGPPHKLDVTVPHGGIADFVDALGPRVAAAAPTARVWWFGHLGDGNLHVNVSGLDPEDEALGGAVDEAVLSLVADFGGSISAEHGIGTAKRPWLGLSRSPEEIAVFRAIKHAWDPQGTLNPNVLLPPA